MARPKTGRPPKRSLNLTVDEKTKQQLEELSSIHQKSISLMVAEWADEETKRVKQAAERAENQKKYEEALLASTILPDIVKNNQDQE